MCVYKYIYPKIYLNASMYVGLFTYEIDSIFLYDKVS
jgi:hypothetical protein